MQIFWRVRYFDTSDKQFKNRELWLDTSTVVPAIQAAVEMCQEMRDFGNWRGMLRYRHLFREESHIGERFQGLVASQGEFRSVFIHDYFEDENGKELSAQQMAVSLSGRPNAVLVPPGTSQHDINYMFSDKRPIPIELMSLTQDQLTILGYFARDLRELLTSAFYRDGPGTFGGPANGALQIQTSVTEEEIRSFVTIFRRLYMANEPANFAKAVAIFGDVAKGYPLTDWVIAVAKVYITGLELKPDFTPIVGRENWTFSRKRLIDVFICTQYAHQPDDRRTSQFQQCLADVGGRSDLLTWLFLGELWCGAIHMRNAGLAIVDFYDRYCKHNQISPSILPSIGRNHSGIGKLEKPDARRTRIVGEKVDELAVALWKENNSPEGGPSRFLQQARQQLEKAMNGS